MAASLLSQADNHTTGALADALVALRAQIGYLPAPDQERIETVFRFAEEAHRGQKRRSGEPYITHPVTVATIVASMQMDSHAVMAALLHDVVEDCSVTLADLGKQIDTKTAKIVDGVTKLMHLEQATDAVKQAHNFQKMVLAMCDDVRVIAVKMADRLHNMRTLDAMSRQKQCSIARETQDIYVGIARRLGMNDIADELEDLCFRYQHPMRHMLITKALQAAHIRNQDYLLHIEAVICSKLEDRKITARVFARQKAPASIYRKMRGDRRKVTADTEGASFLSFYKIMDIHGVRVIVSNVDDCYRALGALHQLYKPVPGRFKDYISNAKPNGYQSLHTTLIGPKQFPIEIQIRTAAMNRYIEHGIAVHWLYKETDETTDFAKKQNQWLNQLKELQAKSATPTEFLEVVKKDFYDQEIYVFTRESDIVSLPRGASAIDFAYSVHTDLGDHARACRIDGVRLGVTTKLKTGQRVEIITAKRVMIDANWLRHTVTSRAIVNIKQHLSKALITKTPTRHQKIDIVAIGSNLLRSDMMALGLPEPSERRVRKALLTLGVDTSDDARRAIGEQTLSTFECIEALFPPTARHPKVPLGKKHTMQFAKCCLPLPEEEIVVMSTNRGLLLHRAGCHNVVRNKPGQEKHSDILPVMWPRSRSQSEQFMTHIRAKVYFADRGVFTKLANIITNKGALVHKMDTVDIDSTTAFFDLWLLVNNRVHLLQIMRTVRRLNTVESLVRVC